MIKLNPGMDFPISEQPEQAVSEAMMNAAVIAMLTDLGAEKENILQDDLDG